MEQCLSAGCKVNQQNTPCVSIILPIFNGLIFLHDCINRVLCQTYTNFELLIIDDGSQDGTQDFVLKSLPCDNRVRYFYKNNGGVSSARNLGILEARGDWITFVDVDDIVGPNWLDLFMSNINSSELIIQGFTTTDCKWTPGFTYVGDVEGALIRLYGTHSVGYVWNKMFRRNVIIDNQVYFNESFKFREDEDFVLRYMKYITTVSSVLDGDYYYYAPNFDEKYKGLDNFHLSYSLFANIKKFKLKKQENIFIGYLDELTQALFSSFNKKIAAKERLEMYLHVVKKDYIILTNLSAITKFILGLPKSISYVCLRLKTVVVQWLR